VHVTPHLSENCVGLFIVVLCSCCGICLCCCREGNDSLGEMYYDM
jgi:hypothetical protein